eukprot:508203-Hanusia_phi.AAC.2
MSKSAATESPGAGPGREFQSSLGPPGTHPSARLATCSIPGPASKWRPTMLSYALVLALLHEAAPFMPPPMLYMPAARLHDRHRFRCTSQRSSTAVPADPPRRVIGGGGFPVTPVRDWDELDRWIKRREEKGEASGERHETSWVLLTDKRSTLREIFNVELEHTMNCEEVEWGVWALGSRPSQARLRSLACSRALIKVLAGPCKSVNELCQEVEKMNLCLDDQTTWTMHHERISDCQHAGAKIKTSEIVCSLARKIAGGQALPHSQVNLRFVLLECGSGLYFGLGYWSRQDESFLDFRGEKPFTFNAALEPDVATAVVNVLAAREEVQEEGEWGVVNACSGSGTLMFAALKGGADWVLGIDKNQRCVEGARDNILHFGFQVDLLDEESKNRMEKGDCDGGQQGGRAFLIHRDIGNLDAEDDIIPGFLRTRGNTMGIVADLPFGKNLVTHKGELHRIVRGIRRISGEHLVCLISGDDISDIIIDNDFEIIEQAKSFNGKHYVLYMTFVLARTRTSDQDDSPRCCIV